MTAQTALLCGCGSLEFSSSGLCPRCARRQRLSRECFDGQREAVLLRDGRQCQGCGETAASQIVVHHRRPGSQLKSWKITICRACHAKVHHKRPTFGFMVSTPLLFALWREVNRRRPVQRTLALCAPGAPPEAPKYQPPLFD